MNEKYITKALTKVLTMPALSNGKPYIYAKSENLTAYCDNYCAWCVPSHGNNVTNPDALEMPSLMQRFRIDDSVMQEVKDTGIRKIVTGKKKFEIAVFKCVDFEIHVNTGMLKLFSSLDCRFWAKSYDTQMLIEDIDRIPDGMAIGIIMPVKPTL